MSQSNEKAVALKYNHEQGLAPVVIASGYGQVAQNIIDVAEQRGIPVYRDDSAASMLCMLDVGANIPEELYQVVSAIYTEILATASKIKHGGQPISDIADKQKLNSKTEAAEIDEQTSAKTKTTTQTIQEESKS